MFDHLIYLGSQATTRHPAVEPLERAIATVRNAFRHWADARRSEAQAQQQWNAELREARRLADLSRAMNGIATDDARRYD